MDADGATRDGFIGAIAKETWPQEVEAICRRLLKGEATERDLP